MATIPLIGPSTKTQALRSSPARTINMYPDVIEEGKTTLMPAVGSTNTNYNVGGREIVRLWPTAKNERLYALLLTNGASPTYQLARFVGGAVNIVTDVSIDLSTVTSGIVSTGAAEVFITNRYSNYNSNIILTVPANTTMAVIVTGGFEITGGEGGSGQYTNWVVPKMSTFSMTNLQTYSEFGLYYKISPPTGAVNYVTSWTNLKNTYYDNQQWNSNIVTVAMYYSGVDPINPVVESGIYGYWPEANMTASLYDASSLMLGIVAQQGGPVARQTITDVTTNAQTNIWFTNREANTLQAVFSKKGTPNLWANISGFANVLSGQFEPAWVVFRADTALSLTNLANYELIDLAEGFTNLAYIGNGSNLVTWDDDNPFTTLTNVTNITKALNLITYHNYFIYVDEFAKTFFWSAVDNPNSWNPLSFATAEFSGDSIVALQAIKDHLWIFGQRSIEVWADDGTTPFRKIPGAVFNTGAISKYSMCFVGDEVAFLGTDTGGSLGVYITEGLTIKKISNEFVETEIQKRPISQGLAKKWHFFTHLGIDRSFLVLNYWYETNPGNSDSGASKCFVWDQQTGMWHERQTGTYSTWQYLTSATLRDNPFGKPITYVASSSFKSSATNTLDKIAPFITTENFTNTTINIIKTRITDHVRQDNRHLFHTRVFLEAQTMAGGPVNYDPVVISTGWSGTHANINLQYSDNDGLTWKVIKPEKQFGFSNTTTKRVEWFRLGRSLDRIYKWTSNSTAPLYISGAYADITGGEH